MECFFDGSLAGLLPDGEAPAAGGTVTFLPYRSVAHLRLTKALARHGAVEVELRAAGSSERRTITALTARTITLGAAT